MTGSRGDSEVSARRVSQSLRTWAGHAQIALGIAALLGGAGPGAIAQVLGLDPLIGIAGNFLSTAPLALAVALFIVLAFAANPDRENVSAVGLIGLGAAIAFGSLLLATFLGGIEDPFRAAGFGGRPGESPGLVDIIGNTLGVYLELYGLPRFFLSVVSGAFLGFWIVKRAGGAQGWDTSVRQD